MILRNWPAIVTHLLGLANAVCVVHSISGGEYSTAAVNSVAVLYISRYGR